MVYLQCKVYGPYSRKDGRQHVVVVSNSSTRTVSYPRYLVEVAIDSYLKDNEDVHHKNGDFTDNRLENLEVITHKKHCIKHQQKYTDTIATCVRCGKSFFMSATQARYSADNKRRGKSSPFCSKKCSGLYGKEIQMSAEKETSQVESPKVGETLSIGNPEPIPNKGRCRD